MFGGSDQVTLGSSPRNPSNQIYFPPHFTMTYCHLQQRSLVGWPIQGRKGVSVSAAFSVRFLGLPAPQVSGRDWREEGTSGCWKLQSPSLACGSFSVCLRFLLLVIINLLKPTGWLMHQQFNIQQLYVLPTLYLCVLCLSESKQRLVPLTA